MKDRAALKAELKAWIAKANGQIKPEDIQDDSALMDDRIITSLQLVELIVFIEELRNQTLDVEDLGPGVFKDLNTILDTFFGPKPHA